MKAILKFKLPRDQDAFNRASKAMALCSFVWDFQNYLRSQQKYALEPDDIEKIYSTWFEMLGDNDIDIDDLLK